MVQPFTGGARALLSRRFARSVGSVAGSSAERRADSYQPRTRRDDTGQCRTNSTVERAGISSRANMVVHRSDRRLDRRHGMVVHYSISRGKTYTPRVVEG